MFDTDSTHLLSTVVALFIHVASLIHIYLHWYFLYVSFAHDSSVAWLHGPAGKEDGSCKTILCGPDSFLESIEGLSDTEARKLHSKCTPTCTALTEH